MMFEIAAMPTSTFRGTLEFFNKLGVYDVLLPFILVFTIVYAIMEKTKIFGTEKAGDITVTRKNLNAMTAFVSAFFVVASTQLVAIISEVLAHTVLLLLLSICFLILVGSFHKGDKEFGLEGKWKTTFMWIMFIGIVVIFLNAMGLLSIIYENLFFKFDSATVSSIVLIIVIVGFIMYVTANPAKEDKKKE